MNNLPNLIFHPLINKNVTRIKSLLYKLKV